MTNEEIYEKVMGHKPNKEFGVKATLGWNDIDALMNEAVKNCSIHVVTQQSELVCDCLPMSTQVSTINGRYICCTCNKPLLSQTCG